MPETLGYQFLIRDEKERNPSDPLPKARMVERLPPLKRRRGLSPLKLADGEKPEVMLLGYFASGFCRDKAAREIIGPIIGLLG